MDADVFDVRLRTYEEAQMSGRFLVDDELRRRWWELLNRELGPFYADMYAGSEHRPMRRPRPRDTSIVTFKDWLGAR